MASFGSVSLLLLIACTNIVALLLARAAQRQHEIAVRFSMGAPRGALIAQLLTETFILALLGAALGLLVAGAAAGVFRSLAAGLPRVEEIHLDGRIVLYSLACSLLVTILGGLFPPFVAPAATSPLPSPKSAARKSPLATPSNGSSSAYKSLSP